ncbi:MAG: nuclear transport factor 2 family protein [Spongiibacteraceae bacterium]
MTQHDPVTQANHQLVRDFFLAIAKGEVPDHLVTDDMTFWSVNSGTADKARFQGAMKILSSIFAGTLVYDIESLTAEEDRVVAEIKSHGTLAGEPFNNTHVFLFRVRDGRIANAMEYMNQFVVREKIIPQMQAAMSRAQT